MKLFIHLTPVTVTEVLLFAISGHMAAGQAAPLQNAFCVLPIAGLSAVNIDSTPVLPRHGKVVAAYRR